MDNKIKFALPTLWNHWDLTVAIVEFQKVHPECFYPGVTIGAVYDNFPYCLWDGGRIYSNYAHASIEEIIERRDYLLENNIPLRMIFTNPVIKEKHLVDRFCNLVTSTCEHENNELVVNSPLLENYLKENYPKYSYISSTTKCNLFDASLSEVDSNQYKYICLDYGQNHNFAELDKLNQEQKDKVEFLCNAICPSGCQNRKEHYRLNGLFYINYMKFYNMAHCGVANHTLSPVVEAYPTHIMPQEIYETYVPKGFSMFKLEGRTLDQFEVALNCAKYLIQPQYIFFFLREIWSERK